MLEAHPARTWGKAAKQGTPTTERITQMFRSTLTRFAALLMFGLAYMVEVFSVGIVVVFKTVASLHGLASAWAFDRVKSIPATMAPAGTSGGLTGTASQRSWMTINYAYMSRSAARRSTGAAARWRMCATG
jgi:hypothetical protein